MENQPLYPARVMIKVIMSAKKTESENMKGIVEAIAPLGCEPSSFSSRLSKKGRWMSISFFAEIDSTENLELIYGRLEDVPGTRMIL